LYQAFLLSGFSDRNTIIISSPAFGSDTSIKDSTSLAQENCLSEEYGKPSIITILFSEKRLRAKKASESTSLLADSREEI